MSALETLKQKLARKIKEAAQGVKKQEVNAEQEPNFSQPVQNFDDQKMYFGEESRMKYLNKNPEQVSKQDIFYQMEEEQMAGNMNQNMMDEEVISVGQDQNQLEAPFEGEYIKKDQQAIQSQAQRKQFIERKKSQEAWLKPKISPFIVHTLTENSNEGEIQKQIQKMLQQPQELLSNQNNEQEEENQKYKQLMLNTIKNKTKKKHKRPMDKPTPFQKLSQPYKQIKLFAAYLPQYEQRRNKQLFGNSVDLGVRTLHEVVLQCYLEGLISKQLLISIEKIGVQKELQFIKKFAQNRLNEYDFNSVKFTPLDFRRLCTILICHNKEKYTMGERIYCVFKQITDFYEVIYQMTQDEYLRLCNSLKITYKLNWWNSIALKEGQMFEIQNANIDTSTIYKPKASPLFGADINDPQKDFYKSKKRVDPSHYIQPKAKKNPKSNSSDFSLTDRNNAFSSKNQDCSEIPENSDESEDSSQVRKRGQSMSEKPQFNDSDDMSDISSLRRSRKLKHKRKNSLSMSQSQPNKDQLSSVNSSRLSQDSEQEELSDSLGSEDSEPNSSAINSMSISSTVQRKKQKKNNSRPKVGLNKKKSKNSKRNKNLNSQIESDSENDNRDVFLESSDQEIRPSKKNKPE